MTFYLGGNQYCTLNLYKRGEKHQKPIKIALFLIFFRKKFGGKEKMSTFAIPNEKKTFEKTNSRIAQLVRASDC